MAVSCNSNKVQDEAPNLQDLPNASGMVRSGDVVPEPEPLTPEDEAPIDVEAGKDLKDVEGVYLTRTIMTRVGSAYSEHLLFNPSANVIYPGNVFVGNTIATGDYVPVPSRKVMPIVLSATLTPDNNPNFHSETLAEASFSSYNEILNNWRQGTFKTPAVETLTDVHEVSDSKSFRLKAGASYQNESFNFGANLNAEHSKKKNHVVAKFIQKVFNVTMDDPRRPILTSVNMNDLDGVMPVYINSVTYGRMAYVLVSSDAAVTDIQAAINFMIPTGAGNVDPALEANYNRLFADSKITALLVGGTADQHGKMLTEGWEGVKQCLAAPMEIHTALPISYTLAYVNDNKPAKVMFMGEYPVRKTYFVPNAPAFNLKLHVSDIMVKAGLLKKKFVYGTADITLPNGKKETLMNIQKSNSFQVNTADEFVALGNKAGEVSIRLERGEMSLDEFLNQKVTVSTDIYNTGALGVVGTSLGKETLELSLRDFFFYAKHEGSINLTARANKILEHSSALKVSLEWEALQK